MSPAHKARTDLAHTTPDAGVVVEIDDPGGRLSPTALAWLRDHGRRAASALAASGEVRVRIVADPEMAAAHERYQNTAGTTDVLTFDLSPSPPRTPDASPGPSARTLDADLLVCLDEATRQAAARSHTPERELLLYIIHGVLHCLGHDDHDDAAAARMHALEDLTLETIGVGATFSREARHPAPTPEPTP